MKRVLCALLAMLTLATGLSFPVTAAEATTSAASASTVDGFDILVTDSETLSGWQSFEAEGLPAKKLVAMNGHGNVMSLTHSGTMYAGGGWANPNGNGAKPTNGVKLAYLSSTPYDISDMNYFVFDVYVSHPDKISNKNFFVELSSAGKNDKEENSIEATLAAMKGEPIVAGWNRIYLDLDSLSEGTGSDAGKPAMNEKKWNFFRIYNQTAFNAGEKFVLAFDNVGFAFEKYTPDLEEFETQFTVLGATETPYLVSAGSVNGTSGRYADKQTKIVYKYPLEQLTKAEQILWTARVYNQFHLEASLDGTNYETVYRYNVDLDTLIESGNNNANTAFKGWQMSGLGTTDMTFNLTETVDKLVCELGGKRMLFDGESVPAGAKIVASTSTDYVKQGNTSLKTTSPQVRLEATFDAMDVSAYENGYLHMWVYVTDFDNINRGYIELTSSGEYDVEEISWRVQDYITQNGWNELWLPMSGAIGAGAADLERVNYLRLYTILNTNVAADMYFDDIYFAPEKNVTSEVPDTLYLRIGDAYPYAIIKNEDGTYSEDIERTSGLNCGSGGQIFASAPVKLSVSYPWGTIMPAATDSVSFSVNTPDENAYIYGSAASYSQWHVRFADKLAYFCYAYPVKNIQNATSIKWKAKTGGQLLLDVSTDFENWTEIYRFTAPVETMVANPNTTKGTATETYDITEAVLKTATAATDRVYIRIRDSYPYTLNADGSQTTTLNGSGGSVSDTEPIVFTVEYDVNATEQTTTRNESVFYRFMPTTSTEKKGATHNDIGTITTANEFPYIVTDHYRDANIEKARLYSNDRYYYGDKLQHLVYAFPAEQDATLTSVSFKAMMGGELAVSISDSPTGPWYEGEVRTAEELAEGVAKDAALDDIVRVVDLSEAARSLGALRGELVYVRISDSDTSDGVGGRTWGDVAAEFTCAYTVTDTTTAQPAIGRGAGHTFTATSATEKTGANHTNIGTVTDSDEYPYMVLDQYAADGSNKAYMYQSGTFYFTDKLRYLLYAFPIEDGAVLETAAFQAKMGAEMSISVSDNPTGPWREVEVRTAAEIAAGTAATASLTKQIRTVDLSAAVRQIGTFAGDKIYVRLSDSVLTTGSGCQIDNAAVTFTCTYFVHHDKKNADSALKFKSGSLALTNDFAIHYSMSVPASYTNTQLRVGYSADTLKLVEPTVNGTTLTYEFSNIPAQRLGDKIYTTLIAEDANGKTAVVHKTYSVRQYCENMLNKTSDATLKTLLSDALTYSASAQAYARYKTDDLATNVNATLTPSSFDFNLVKGERGVSGTKSDLADWYSATLMLDTAMTLNMTFTAANVDDVAVNVQVGDRTEETLTDFLSLGGGMYRASYPIMAYEFDETLTANLLVGGVKTGRTLTYSVGGYIKSTYETAPATRKTLLEAIANYGMSVDAYVAEHPELMGAVRNEDNVIYSAPTAYVGSAEYSRAIAYNDKNTNLSLLQNVMNRAKAGEDVTVATIGGSITAGSSSSNNATKSYSALFRDWWKTTFPSATITHVNAGIGATTSYLGVHRVADHVISKAPDVCIVEFSVNDYHEDLYGETYESLVAKLLDNDIAVMLVFTVKESGDSMQAVHSAIGEKYHLPMLSYGDAIFPTIEAGQRTWADISPDNIHPNDYGHAYAGEIIWKYLNSVYAYTPDTVTPVGYDSAALKATPFYNAELLGPVATSDTTLLTPYCLGAFEVNSDVSYSKFDDAWVYNPASTAATKEMTFTATFSRFGLMYLRTVDGLSGKCEVLIDGEVVATLDGDFSGGWGNYTNTAEVYKSDVTAAHTVTIRMIDATKSFTLCRLLVTDYSEGGT